MDTGDCLRWIRVLFLERMVRSSPGVVHPPVPSFAETILWEGRIRKNNFARRLGAGLR